MASGGTGVTIVRVHCGGCKRDFGLAVEAPGIYRTTCPYCDADVETKAK